MKDKLIELKAEFDKILKLDYADFEKIIFKNIAEINTLWSTLEKVRQRIRENVPKWLLK